MDQIPPKIKEFIEHSVQGIDELRVLLLVASNPEQAWNATTVLSKLYLDPIVSEKILAGLVVKGCVSVLRVGDQNEYRFAPRTEDLRNTILELIEFDRQRPVTLIRMVYESSKSPAQAFSDAFKFTKEK